MVRSGLWSRGIGKDGFYKTSLILIPVMLLALLLLGVLIILAPAIIANILPASYTSRLLASSVAVLLICPILLAIIIILRLDEFAAVGTIAISLYGDWYLGLKAASLLIVLALLLIFFLVRSPRYPWIRPRGLLLWLLFLLFALFAEIRGDRATPYDIFYYPTIIFGALIFFWLGTVIARDIVSVRRFFKILAAFGTLVALHSIILAITGTFLLRSSHFDDFLNQSLVSNYLLDPSIGAYRIGAFFVDPNWNGTFFAVMLCIPLGLFAESTLLLEKALYLAEVFIILPALLFTYSAGAWIGAFVGVIAFVVFVGRSNYRILIPFISCLASLMIIVWFPLQVGLLLQHATASTELSSRVAIWQTAWRVIQALPLTGVGLGLESYQIGADPYRVPAQYFIIDHPHNSYLELGAMGGLPVLITFLALLLLALRFALRNWTLADVKARSLLAGGIAAVVALCINSWSINGWTLPPLAATGWLILGVISSPLLAQSQVRGMTQEKGIELTNNHPTVGRSLL